ncbi:MAG: hypothetical protein AB7K68_11695 [Bacteriovoracia bacterium]
MMSIFRLFSGLSATILLCLFLVGCLGSETKTLGKKASAGTGTAATDADTFSLSFAYREGTSRVVQVQGVRSTAAAGLVNTCGVTGASCTCDFYKVGNNTTVTSSLTNVGISKENNSFNCTIAGADPVSDFNRVRLRTIDGKKTTGFVLIKNTLTLQEVIGDLSLNKVNKIYKYSCSRTFFEGEGVTSQCAGGGSSCINCVLNQKLGLIMANYDYYVFDNNAGGGNKNSKFTASFWPTICLRPDAEFARANCGSSSPDKRYGLYSEPAGPFTIKIQMTRAPEQLANTPDLTSTYGYAAAPDSSGNCPTGLVQVRPYMAQPASITAGSIDGLNPASNFLNVGDGILNNTVIETSQPATFNVFRQPNQTQCSGVDGNCKTATFGGVSTVQAVAYTPLSPVVCVIPKALVDTL